MMEGDSLLDSTSEDHAHTFNSWIKCRDQQIKLLLSLFGKRQHMTPGSLFIYGHTGTGKSLVVQTLLSKNKLPYICINCVECSSPRFLFEHILNNMPHVSHNFDSPNSATFDGTDNDEYLHCDDMTSFIHHLVKIVQSSDLKNETLYIVFDKAERLRDAHTVLLPAILRLQELSGLNICIILISEIVWEKFRSGTGFCEPYSIHFPDYNKQELKEIMCLDGPATSEKDLYSLYVNIVLSVFHMVCRDLRELRHVARLNYPYFIEPVNKGEATAANAKKLWRNIEPHLKIALKSVYLREVSSLQWKQMQQAELENPDSDFAKATPSRSHVELPYYSKYLLIAAYLASYNPMKYDRRFFAKVNLFLFFFLNLYYRNDFYYQASNHLLGPKVFPIDRLMAIFYSIIEGNITPSAQIYVQISSLVSLHLLTQVGGEDRIATPKYKCMVNLDFIRSIAKTVHFDVMRYLYDFL
ncbi:unnamed protein product [Lymnaea stagnalis]|uniref:Origin recognition complex subunit 5 n=1 Tax=Lymnaea stagnalis TaxID=6523 RepID=A0AAV2HEK8_LYMST